ncbi:hypothetical protein QR680_008944 [Steinernema hermaphroditum]|uniref:Uncharacterized protein n=1 Tax=Steinernema hermaphroditum TaxID=289476 RepID=A0AA39III2_9BILA|nr:hypothetical protein QR680_008944 [Steinernema hermaphroditum]
MASKTLLFVAFFAVSALASVEPKCDCGAVFTNLRAVSDDILGFFFPLAFAESEVEGCAVRETHELAENLLYKAIVKVSELSGTPVPHITERPFALNCAGLKPSVEKFDVLVKELEAAHAESVRCKCRNTALESLLVRLSGLYHNVQKSIGN